MDNDAEIVNQCARNAANAAKRKRAPVDDLAKIGFLFTACFPVLLPLILFSFIFFILLHFGCSKFDLESERNAIECIKVRANSSMPPSHAKHNTILYFFSFFASPKREKMNFEHAKAFTETEHKHNFAKQEYWEL